MCVTPPCLFCPTLSQDRPRPIPLAQPEACPQRSERPVRARSPHRSRNGYPGCYSGTRGEALPHMLPPDRYSLNSWLTIPRGWHGATAQLPEPCTQTGAQVVTTAGRLVGHWTRVQDSPTVASTVTQTRILVWWNVFYVPVDEHIQRSYTLTSKFVSTAYWSDWQTPWTTLYVFL